MLMDTCIKSSKFYSFGIGIFNILTKKSELSGTFRCLFKKVEQIIEEEGF